MASTHRGVPKGRHQGRMEQMNAPRDQTVQAQGMGDGARAPGGPAEAAPVGGQPSFGGGGQAAFGSGGGAAWVFRDLASI